MRPGSRTASGTLRRLSLPSASSKTLELWPDSTRKSTRRAEHLGQFPAVAGREIDRQHARIVIAETQRLPALVVNDEERTEMAADRRQIDWSLQNNAPMAAPARLQHPLQQRQAAFELYQVGGDFRLIGLEVAALAGTRTPHPVDIGETTSLESMRRRGLRRRSHRKERWRFRARRAGPLLVMGSSRRRGRQTERRSRLPASSCSEAGL